MAIQFRREVTQHQQNRWNGRILLPQKWPVWISVLATVAFMTALTAFLLFGSYTRRINVTGEITTEPHTINLYAPEQGIVSQFRVTTGQHVSAGAPLYSLDVSQVTHAGNLTTTTLAVIDRQIRQLEDIIVQLQNSRRETLAGIQQQLDRYVRAQEGLQAMVVSAKEALGTLGRSRDSYERSLSRGLINTDQMNNQRYLYQQQQSVYQGLNAQFIQQSAQITGLRSELVTRAAEFDNQISQSRYQLDALTRQQAEASARGSRLIVAPAAGVVSALSVTSGQMVSAGDSVVQLVPPDGRRFYLVIWLPDESRPFVSPGDNINIRYAAFPYEKFGQFPGRVLTVSAAPVPARELENWASVPRSASGQVSGSWYKVIVAPGDTDLRGKRVSLPLASGMLAQSTLFLEKRPLYQWMLSPYYSLKKSITGPVNEPD